MTTDVEWKVKLIVTITVEQHPPLSVSIPFPPLIGLLMVMLACGDKLALEWFSQVIIKFNHVSGTILTLKVPHLMQENMYLVTDTLCISGANSGY